MLQQLLKRTMPWCLGPPENIKENFGIGTCPAMTGSVVLQPAKLIVFNYSLIDVEAPGSVHTIR